MVAEKLTTIPEGYSPELKFGRLGLFRDSDDGGEWLVSTPENEQNRLPALLRIFFEEDLVQSIYQEILSQLQK